MCDRACLVCDDPDAKEYGGMWYCEAHKYRAVSLDIHGALAEFPKEIERLMIAAKVSYWKGIDHLLATALRWLEGKELVGLGPTTSHRRFMPKDSLRWALEEVREHLKRKKPGPDRVGQCWCCANNFPGCCPYEGDEFSPTPCDKWADAPLVTKPGE